MTSSSALEQTPRRPTRLAPLGNDGDFDGAADLPTGLEDVSRCPALLGELSRRGWSEADLAKLAGGNVLRVMREAEAVSRGTAAAAPAHAVLPDSWQQHAVLRECAETLGFTT